MLWLTPEVEYHTVLVFFKLYNTGIQFAGAHLRELQNAMKNPATNMGLILGEATKRAFRTVGLASVSKELVPFAHSSLSEPAGLASQVLTSYFDNYGKCDI